MFVRSLLENLKPRPCRIDFAIREFKELRRRRRGKRRLKNEFIFTYESRDTPRSFTLFMTVKTITKLNLGHGDKFEIEI